MNRKFDKNLMCFNIIYDGKRIPKSFRLICLDLHGCINTYLFNAKQMDYFENVFYFYFGYRTKAATVTF